MIPMTKSMMGLGELVEKSGDADLLREMIGYAAERLMKLEVGMKTGADYGEKSGERLAQRNGDRNRDWRVRVRSERPGPWSCAFRSYAGGATFRSAL